MSINQINFFNPYVLTEIPDFINKDVNALLGKADSNASFLQWKYPHDFSKEFEQQIESYIAKILGLKEISISGGWMNATKYMGLENHFGWHNENGIGPNKKTVFKGDCAGILWLCGEKNKGGNLKIIDEAGQVQSISFEPPALIVLKRDTLHSVESYYSSERRISFNFDF